VASLLLIKEKPSAKDVFMVGAYVRRQKLAQITHLDETLMDCLSNLQMENLDRFAINANMAINKIGNSAKMSHMLDYSIRSYDFRDDDRYVVYRFFYLALNPSLNMTQKLKVEMALEKLIHYFWDNNHQVALAFVESIFVTLHTGEVQEESLAA
jgi:hypothetical protein